MHEIELNKYILFLWIILLQGTNIKLKNNMKTLKNWHKNKTHGKYIKRATKRTLT